MVDHQRVTGIVRGGLSTGYRPDEIAAREGLPESGVTRACWLRPR